MAKRTGVREHRGGIEIRWQYKKEPYSRFINQAPTERNLQEAARQRKKFVELCKLGEYVEEEPTVVPTFEQVAKAMLEYKATRLKQSTLDSMLSKLNNHWFDIFHLPMDQIKLPDIRKVEKRLVHLSAKTRKNSLSDARQVFNHAFDEGIIQENPFDRVRPPKVQKPPIDSFSAEEKEAILSQLSLKYRLFYLFMFDSGMRTGEVQGLQHTDIEDDYAFVQRSIYKGGVSPTKTHQARRVYLSPRTISLYKEYVETLKSEEVTSYWVFSPRGSIKPYATERTLTLRFKQACEDAKVRYRRPYQCRHTYVTLALRKGVTPITVANQIGDRLETMQRNYADVMAEANNRAELAKAHE